MHKGKFEGERERQKVAHGLWNQQVQECVHHELW
jgi:hypothetical protein